MVGLTERGTKNSRVVVVKNRNAAKEFVKKKPRYLVVGERTIHVKVHTNNIENLWARLKTITRLFHGILVKKFADVLDESLLLRTFRCYNQQSIISWIV